jgi:hypothetical protein
MISGVSFHKNYGNPSFPRFRARRQWSCWLLAALALQLTARADQIIYDDALENSWAGLELEHDRESQLHRHLCAFRNCVHQRHHYQWLECLVTVAQRAFDSSAYTNLTFWINGGATGGQQLRIYAELSSGAQPAINLPTLAAGTWQQMNFSLSALGVANQPNFIRFSIQDRSGAAEPDVLCGRHFIAGRGAGTIRNQRECDHST